MTRDDLPELVEALKYMSRGYDVDFTADRFDFYYEMLKELPLPAVLQGLKRCGRTCAYFPKPAEIWGAAGQLIAPADAAERAWERFRYALQHVPIYDTVDFGDPILHAVIRSLFGGWPQTIEIEARRMPMIRVDFMRAYIAFARTDGHSPEPLLGTMPMDVIQVPALPQSTAIVARPALPSP